MYATRRLSQVAEFEGNPASPPEKEKFLGPASLYLMSVMTDVLIMNGHRLSIIKPIYAEHCKELSRYASQNESLRRMMTLSVLKIVDTLTGQVNIFFVLDGTSNKI